MVELNGKPDFEGLPPIMVRHLMSFTPEELRKYPTTCLNVILK